MVTNMASITFYVFSMIMLYLNHCIYPLLLYNNCRCVCFQKIPNNVNLHNAFHVSLYIIVNTFRSYSKKSLGDWIRVHQLLIMENRYYFFFLSPAGYPNNLQDYS